jgi:hypothetical protein
MVYFQTKNSNLGKFWRALQWKMIVYLMGFGPILRPFDTFWGHLVYFVVPKLVDFFPVLVFCTKKNLATLTQVEQPKTPQECFFCSAKEFLKLWTDTAAPIFGR